MTPGARSIPEQEPGNGKYANGTSPLGLPAGQALTGPQAEELLAQLTDARSGGGDLMRLASLLSSGQRTVGSSGKAPWTLAEARYRALVEQIPAGCAAVTWVGNPGAAW